MFIKNGIKYPYFSLSVTKKGGDDKMTKRDAMFKKNGFVNEIALATRVALAEDGPIECSVAQTMQIMNLLFADMAENFTDELNLELIKRHR